MESLLALYHEILSYEPDAALRISVRKSMRRLRRGTLHGGALLRVLRRQQGKMSNERLRRELARAVDELEPVFRVDTVVGIRLGRNDEEREYLVRWSGYDSDDDTWEPMGKLVEDGCGDLIAAFHKRIRRMV